MVQLLRTDRPQIGASESALLAALQLDVDTVLSAGLNAEHDAALTNLWSARARRALRRLVRADGKLDTDTLANFRRDEVLVDDLPRSDFATGMLGDNLLANILVGRRRATRRCLLQCLDVLERRGYAATLQRHPCQRAGNPLVFSHDGYTFTYRWARHVYFLGLLQEVLGARLGDEFVTLDIGSSYGIFSALVRREYPASTHILVDLPEQLIAARYFLWHCFPRARIAGVSELIREPSLDRAAVIDYDFVLLPAPLFDRLRAHSADLVTNFGSFCEMSRQYFDAYLKSDAFLSCRYFFTINRVAANPGNHGDISIFDYPIHAARRALHLDVCPMYSVDFSFSQHYRFFTRHYPPPAYFEYIGRLE